MRTFDLSRDNAHCVQWTVIIKGPQANTGLPGKRAIKTAHRCVRINTTAETDKILAGKSTAFFSYAFLNPFNADPKNTWMLKTRDTSRPTHSITTCSHYSHTVEFSKHYSTIKGLIIR